MPRAALALLVAALALLVYAPVARHEFTNFDDDLLITEDADLRLGLSADGIARAFTSTHAGNWVPVTRISWLVEEELHGLAPGATQLGNALVHTVASALLFLVLAAMTSAPGRSFAVAAIFALHPVHVESVAWAAQRRDVLCGLFFIATLGAWSRWVHTRTPASYALAFACAALALFAKPMAVTLPFVLLLLDGWPLGRLQRDGLRSAVVDKLPLLALSAGVVAITLVAQQSAGAARALADVPVSARAANALVSYLLYLRDSFWPSGLAAIYPHPGADVSFGLAGIALLVLAAPSAAALRLADRVPALLIGWLWFLGMLVPVIGLLQVGVQSRADRYLYLPQIGLSIAVVWGVHALVPRDRRGQVALACVLAVALAALGARSAGQVATWRDSVALFDHAASVAPAGNHVAWINLGHGLLERGRLDEAEAALERAVQVRDDLAGAWLLLGLVRARQQSEEQAIHDLRRALALDDSLDEGHAALGLLLGARGELEPAIAHYRRALELRPDRLELHGRMAPLLRASGRSRQALASYEIALEAAPDDAQVENNLAWLLATDPALRDPESAVRHAESAARRSHYGQAHVLDTLAVAYDAAGRPDDARRTARRALALAESQGEDELAAEIRTRSFLSEAHVRQSD